MAKVTVTTHETVYGLSIGDGEGKLESDLAEYGSLIQLDDDNGGTYLALWDLGPAGPESSLNADVYYTTVKADSQVVDGGVDPDVDEDEDGEDDEDDEDEDGEDE